MNTDPKSNFAATEGCAPSAGYAPEPRTTLIRLVVIKPYTRRAIGLWAPTGSHTRSSKIMNHRLGRKRAWTFRTRSAHTIEAMPAPRSTTLPARRLSALGISVLFPCLSGALKERQPVGLLPCWRLAPAILPIVGSATGAVQRGDDVGGGVVVKLVGEGHGESVAHENKSAMPKISLAKNRHCRHNSSVMKSKYYRVICKENGEEKLFDSKNEIKQWASKATITLGCDLTLEVFEVIEKETQMNASWETGEVEEVAA